ncbi:MAG TPA: saccharopine dehydrogenase NADP-binding domain-containing protein [Bryobacteraceae bacterium]
MTTRQFDIVLYGATGFTGRQAVRYLTENAPTGLAWAIAGRDRKKLDSLQGCISVLVADISERSAIDRLISKTRVLISTAGPFSLYGGPIVDACVRFGTDYVDITG